MQEIPLALRLVAGFTYIDDTVKTPEDVAQKLQVPFLGMVPKVAGGRALLSGGVPHTFGEGLRSLRRVMTGGPKLHGIVLNGVDLERNKYYYSRYYGYEHTQYYKASAAS